MAVPGRCSGASFAPCLLLLGLLLLGLPLHAQAPEVHSGHEHHGQHGQHGEEQPGIHHDFSDAERWHRIFDDPSRDAWQQPRKVVALLDLHPGMTAVDLGAGTGYFLPYLADAVGSEGRVLGLDPEATLVEFMARRVAQKGLANVEARQIPFDDPQLADASVDRVLIVDTWHHIDGRSAYATRLARALKPGGRIYVVDFTRDSPQGPPPEHRLPPEQVVAELEQGGLEAEVVATDLPYQYVVSAHRSGE